MSDSATADQAVDFVYPVTVEDVGPSTKKVTVEIPGERIAAKLQETVKQVRGKAALPGFRPGHAPRKLVEKRLGSEIRSDLQRELISESYKQALETNKLDVIGEPEFANPDTIKLPESGSLTYSFEVEIRPAFELPELSGISVKRPKVEVTPEHIEEAMKNLRTQQGTMVPVENRGLESKDYVTADFTINLGDKEVGAQKDAQFVLQPGRVGGIFIENIDTELAGLKIGESKTLTVKAPEDHPQQEIRGQEVRIAVSLKDIKKLELAEITETFLEELDFANEAELREALKEQMEIRIKNDVQQSMRDQVVKHLIETIKFEVPAKLSRQQTQQIVQRRASDLMMRGVAAAQIEANIEKLKAGADQQALTELRSFFILDKVAAKEGIDVSEGELNGQIAQIAMQSGERPEKVKQRMDKDGSLMTMYVRMRENKAVDKILESAKIEEIEVKKEETK